MSSRTFCSKVLSLRVLFHESVERLAWGAVLETIRTTFNIDFSASMLDMSIGNAFNPYRGQFNAERILSMINQKISSSMFFVVLSDDIYVPGLNFVFGVALPFRGAIMSTWRFRTENKNLYRLRILKTVRHELGHVFGLSHCNGKCVMRFANSLAELDAKPKDFCERCRQHLVALNVILF